MSKELKAWITLGFLSIIWGTSFILMKRALEVFAPEQVAILRVGLSAVGFAPFFIYHFRHLEWRRWYLYLVVATTGSAIPAFLFATAQTRIGSGMAGVLNCTTPIFTLIMGSLIFGIASSARQTVGILIGFVGTAALIYIDSMGSVDQGQVLYGLLIVAGAVCYGFNTNYIKHHFQHIRSIHISCFAFTMVGIPFLLMIPFTDIPRVVTQESGGWEAFGYVLALTMFSTVLALLFFYKLLQETSAVFASSVTYLIPVVALVWAVVDGEYITIWHIVCLATIVSGVYLTRQRSTY